MMQRFLSAMVLSGILLLGLAPLARSQATGQIAVTVANLRNDNGVLRCGLYAGADGFRKPGREYRGVIAPISGGSATCLFDAVPPGTYAVAAFHAEKNETQIEYGFFGQPKQGYGFSRNPDTTFGPPSFKEAAFDFTGGRLELAVKLSY
jgi:uncharacterized protein (DUF2141 family)